MPWAQQVYTTLWSLLLSLSFVERKSQHMDSGKNSPLGMGVSRKLRRVADPEEFSPPHQLILTPTVSTSKRCCISAES